MVLIHLSVVIRNEEVTTAAWIGQQFLPAISQFRVKCYTYLSPHNFGGGPSSSKLILTSSSSQLLLQTTFKSHTKPHFKPYSRPSYHFQSLAQEFEQPSQDVFPQANRHVLLLGLWSHWSPRQPSPCRRDSHCSSRPRTWSMPQSRSIRLWLWRPMAIHSK